MEPSIKVASYLQEQLHYFRTTHTHQYHTIAGIEWKYLIGGQNNEEALLLLPGAPGLGEIAFQHILRFERIYCVISPSYPSGITTVASLVDGIATILEHEHIDVVSVLGGSYSGMIAQCLVRRHPHKVRKLILDHTSPPSRQRVRIHKVYHRIFALLPLAGIQALFRCGNHFFASSQDAQQRFWSQYFDECVIATLTKEDYLSRIRVCIDFYQNYTFKPNDLYSWPGDLLIIEADNDPYVPPKERLLLKLLYPSAQVHTFAKTGHSAWATEFETFFCVIADFLEGKG